MGKYCNYIYISESDLETLIILMIWKNIIHLHFLFLGYFYFIGIHLKTSSNQHIFVQQKQSFVTPYGNIWFLNIQNILYENNSQNVF